MGNKLAPQVSAAVRSAFEGAHDRIDRAHAHRAELGRTWNSYLEDEPFDFGLKVDDEGNAELWAEVVHAAPRECGVIVGEWLYNLRTALDYALYGLAIADSGQVPPPSADKIQFPICMSADQFRRQEYRLADLTEEHRLRLDEVQPYRSPAGPRAHPLFWLNELARLDRHRAISVVGAAVAEANPVVHAPNSTAVFFEDVDPRVYLEESAVLARFKVTPYRPGDKVEANPQAGIDMEIEGFPGDGPVRDLDINTRLRIIAANVRVIVESIEKETTGRDRHAERTIAADYT